MSISLPANNYYRHVQKEQLERLVRFRSDHPQKRLAAGEAEWTYLSGGQGSQAVLFLPGGLGLAEAWFQIISAFDREYRTIAVTYPPVSSMKDLADGINCILDAEGIQRVHVIGTSMGGMLAQCFVRLNPTRVERLVLANSGAPDKEYADHIEKHNRDSLKYPMWLIRWVSIKALGKHMAAIPADEREFWKAYFTESIYEHWNRESIARQNECILDFSRNYTFQPGELDGMTSRIMIIQSDDDQAIPAGMSSALRELYAGASIYTFHNAGHIPLITHRQEYVEVIREFLKQG